MRTFPDRLRYLRWWLSVRLRHSEVVLLILLTGSLVTASVFFWTERHMWHSYELGRSDVVDSTNVLSKEDFRDALFGTSKTCESIGGFRCAPHLISLVNLQIDGTGALLASVELSGVGSREQVLDARHPRIIGFGHRTKKTDTPTVSSIRQVFILRTRDCFREL